MSAPRSRILGWGFAVPNTVITNDDLAPVVDTSDEWIQKRTGIRERRYVDDDQGSVPLAEKAARAAAEMAGVGLDEIDAIVCGSLSPDIDFPGNSSLLHARLGISPRLVFDIRNQCSAFVYGLSVADQLVRTGAARHVLLVGSDVHSSGLDFPGARGRDRPVHAARALPRELQLLSAPRRRTRARELARRHVGSRERGSHGLVRPHAARERGGG